MNLCDEEDATFSFLACCQTGGFLLTLSSTPHYLKGQRLGDYAVLRGRTRGPPSLLINMSLMFLGLGMCVWGKGADRNYLVCMLKGINFELWSLLLPPTHKQQSFFSLLNRHLIVLFQLEAVVGE